jgi:hypothetical protein
MLSKNVLDVSSGKSIGKGGRALELNPGLTSRIYSKLPTFSYFRELNAPYLTFPYHYQFCNLINKILKRDFRNVRTTKSKIKN